MTKKRFTLKEEMDYSVLLLDNGKRLYTNEVVDLLNAQHETIKQLKEENERLCNFNLHMLLDKKNKEDEEYTVDDVEKMIYALGVELSDSMNGLVIQTLKRNFNEEFKEFDLMSAFDCMVDEVNRVQKLIDLHDILISVNRENWERILNGDME